MVPRPAPTAEVCCRLDRIDTHPSRNGENLNEESYGCPAPPRSDLFASQLGKPTETVLDDPRPPDPPPPNKDEAGMQKTPSSGTGDAILGSRVSRASTGAGGASVAAASIAVNVPGFQDEEAEAEYIGKVMRKQVKRSCVALIFVILFFTGVVMLLVELSKDFVEPDCTGVQAAHLRSCEPCSMEGLWPLMGEWEKSWPEWVKVVLYFIGLIWAFMGVQLVCDQFMAAIEEITSHERILWVEVNEGARRKFHVKTWNATMANLSLMALGSSAPEILLSATELPTKDFFAGKLGPSTIVGSAAFNLLVITAVCVCSIPEGEVRKIDGTAVFWVTTPISVFAYLWMLVILLWSSPDRVEIWEAVTTLFMFPALLILAYAADRGIFDRFFAIFKRKDSDEEDGEWGSQAEAEMAAKIQARVGKELPAGALQLMVQNEMRAERAYQPSRFSRRRAVTAKLSHASHRFSTFNGDSLGSNGKAGNKALIFGFKEPTYVVLECAGHLTLKVVASRDPGFQVQLRYYTSEGSAREGTRFRAVEGVLTFSERQREATIRIEIIDNDSWDPDEEFYVHLGEYVERSKRNSSSRMSAILTTMTSTATLGSAGPPWTFGTQTAVVTVLNDDLPSILAFDVDEIQADEGSTATIGVVRTGGLTGRIECSYQTRDNTAFANKDYTPIKGTIVFEDGETIKMLQVPILVSPDHTYEGNEGFKLVLSDPGPGVKFDPNSEGGETSAICDILIRADVEVSLRSHLIRRIIKPTQCRVGLRAWRKQFISAFYANGSWKEQLDASASDWAIHILTVPWKIVFAIVPPSLFLGGWACFFMSLFMIGFVTSIVGELASLLGCGIGMADEVTAITLVALGTSLPDTLASMQAAQQDDNADNSIGNVMGSNSVNVFLGLGISWTIASIYWDGQGATDVWLTGVYDERSYRELFFDTGRYPNGGFIVPAGALAFSVSVYSCCAVVCVLILVLRRRNLGGELGGDAKSQYRDAAILLFLWVSYVVSSTIYAQSQ